MVDDSTGQRQTAAEGASALQAGRDITITHGLNYEDAKQIALDVFRANFYELAGLAKQEASSRAEEITEAFLHKLSRENPSGFYQAHDPGFQHALYNMQREHAKIGEKELGDLLVDLLVDRTKHPQRDILQIVLDESLITAPKLTEGQLANLSVIFLLRFTRHNGIGNGAQLGEYLDMLLEPLIKNISKNQASFQHLEFTGCGAVSPLHMPLEELFGKSYQGIFLKGFSDSEIANHGIRTTLDSNFLIPCLNDPSKLQVNALNHDGLQAKLTSQGIDGDERSQITALFDYNRMSPEEIKHKCAEVRSYMSAVFDFWSNSSAMNFTLTSVGIAIGHANIKRFAGEFADLAIWIN